MGQFPNKALFLKHLLTLNTFLPIIFLLLINISSIESARSLHEHYNFLKCLEKSDRNSSNSISDLVFTQKTPSYISILESSVRNLRPLSDFSSTPRFIITPEQESQIQATIYCAKKNGIQIRVRSGGHDYEGLSYASDETDTPFLTVDLRKLNSISIKHTGTKSTTATIQAGATLGELYYKISKESNDLAFVAGLCPTVGVGGHLSGGGYGMMSRRFGVAADHIIDAKIIDVNGRILDRKSMGEDLFWAIRGGGGASFGIITEWTVNLLTIPEKVTVFNVSKTVGSQNATDLVHKWQYISDKINENLLIRIIISTTTTSQNKKTVEASFTALFLGGIDELLQVMDQSFPELGLTKEDCQEMRWVQSALYFAGLPIQEPELLLDRTQQVMWSYFKGKSDYVQERISKTGLEEIWKILLEEDVGNIQLQFIPYGGRLSEVSESEIPFPHRSGNIFMIHYGVGWTEDEEEDSEKHMNWIRKLYSYMARHVSKSPRAAYLNYRDLDIGANNVVGKTSYGEAKVWGEKYFKNNFDRLVHVKTRVDPGNFFRNEQSIPPLYD